MDIVRLNGTQEFSVVGKICDRCNRRAYNDSDFGEFHEFVRIRINVGYGAKAFRDGDLMECDLCEKCAKALLGPYLRTIATFESRCQAIAAQTQLADGEASSGKIIWSLLDDLSASNSGESEPQ
ncbi:hypothetical protein [Stenotrophobium rhamnosiphilum]|uniref:Uncharacterized protein n=1 Tax=Stenotrophobium rhamnosiphilum TaxID=2029166 RepID=A0A2T5MCL6_9GAMM|nr:hypothetical protein [Stenotrophobium rhamnosiphilum]PTU30310.1 hypothetical protein CJD38_15300 [Stenotrophobium rhamnosiphilum]